MHILVTLGIAETILLWCVAESKNKHRDRRRVEKFERLTTTAPESISCAESCSSFSLSRFYSGSVFCLSRCLWLHWKSYFVCRAPCTPIWSLLLFASCAQLFHNTSNGACWNILNRERNKNKSCRERDNLKTFLCKTRAIHKHTQSLSWELYINSTYYSWILNFRFLLLLTRLT